MNSDEQLRALEAAYKRIEAMERELLIKAEVERRLAEAKPVERRSTMTAKRKSELISLDYEAYKRMPW
jgi:hypothetical protein